MNASTTRSHLMATSILCGAVALALSSGVQAQTAPAGGSSAPPSGSSGQVNAPPVPAAGAPVPVGGQEAAQPPGSPATAVGEVTVTGSRIRQPNLTSTSPLTVVNQQEFKLQGTARVEDLLNNLPQVVAAQNSGVSNGSDGTAQVNLRNLGATRTLVLVDGKRLEPGTGGVTDINDIPVALVDRVDVVTGGASAVYGSDAVAGVVNFILKKDFEGLRVDAQIGFANHENNNSQAKFFLANTPYLTGAIKPPGNVGTDGATETFTAILGANSPDGKGNITAYAAYRHTDPVLEATRDFSACSLGTFADASGVLSQHLCTGSSNNAYGRFDNTGARNAITGRGTTVRVNNPDGSKTFVPNSGAFVYNFGPTNYFQRQDQNYKAGFFGHYEINKKLDVYADFMFMDDDTNAQIAPSGFFSGTGPNLATAYTFNCNNPLISAAQVAQLCPGIAVTPGATGGGTVTTSIRYRFASTPRNTDFRHDDYKFDLGARGDLGQDWHYDAYLQYGTSILNQNIQNYASERNLQNALNVVTGADGKPRCVINDPRCVPLDIFAAQGANFSPAALAYVLVPGFTETQAKEQIAHADISGDLGQYGIKSPFADGGLGVNFGTEYRREFITIKFDDEQHTADLSGGGGQALDQTGSFDVYELFGEGRLPLVENKPFIHDLNIDVGYRYSDYSKAGNTNTYKGELQYAPTRDLRLRFSYNRAVKAPSVTQLFTPQVANLGGFQDPCSGANPAAANPIFTQAACVNTGLPAGLYTLLAPCASAQCEILVGGNQNLQPETADTYTLGGIFTPRFFKGFTFTADYFNIDIQNVISTGALPSTILTFCAQGVTSYCSLIKRDAQGTINSPQGYVFQTNTNSGSLATRGVDLTATYRTTFADLPIPYVSSIPGSLQISGQTTYTQNLTFQPVPKQGHYDCAGLFGPVCGNPQPNWKANLRATYIAPHNLSFSVNWRYIGGTQLDYNQQNNDFLNNFQPTQVVAGQTVSGLDLADGKISDYSYFDLAATWRFKDRYNFRIGVNNIADRDPPIFDSNVYGISSPNNFGNGNTFPGTYDTLGRTIFVGVTADF